MPQTRNPELYYKVGKAIKSLRDEGVLILGGGFITHNLQEFFSKYRNGQDNSSDAPPDVWAKDFVTVASNALTTSTGDSRKNQLLQTFSHPSYKKAHPTPEHYAPVLVAAGAGEDDEAEIINFNWTMGSFNDFSVQFGTY